MKEGREAYEKQDDAKIQDVTARLEKESHRIAEAMYKTAGGAPGGDGGAPGAGTPGGSSPSGEQKKKDGVIDAEFEETN